LALFPRRPVLFMELAHLEKRLKGFPRAVVIAEHQSSIP
jgi:hypothetical protein